MISEFLSPTILWVGGCFLCCLLVLGLWTFWRSVEPKVYVSVVESLLTPAEQLFYRSLDLAIAGRLQILCKVRLADLFQVAINLSGGNQQKLVMAKWLFRNAEVLMLDEPTRGIDVGAKAEIQDLLRRLAAAGKSILVVSSEVPELVALCDRILVLWRGQLAGEVQHHEATEERILSLACGESIAGARAPFRNIKEGPSHA